MSFPTMMENVNKTQWRERMSNDRSCFVEQKQIPKPWIEKEGNHQKKVLTIQEKARQQSRSEKQGGVCVFVFLFCFSVVI